MKLLLIFLLSFSCIAQDYLKKEREIAIGTLIQNTDLVDSALKNIYMYQLAGLAKLKPIKELFGTMQVYKAIDYLIIRLNSYDIHFTARGDNFIEYCTDREEYLNQHRDERSEIQNTYWIFFDLKD